MDLPSVITIDGPAASGKSTLGELLAHRLGYAYFDTGVLYRALTLLALRHGLSLEDVGSLAHEAAQMRPKVLPPTENDGRQYTILLDDEDVTWAIREPDVERNVSTVSAYPAVRDALREQQRAIGRGGGVVMVGRDIGAIVMPDAPFKVFLLASPEERARRRFSEARAKGRATEYAVVLDELRRRDELDRANTHQPPDALVIDSDGLNPDAIVDELLAALERRTHPERGRRMAPRILVADDDSNLRLLLETILRDAGFEVTVVPSGEALVRAAIGNPPDLLLVDVMMPLMDGLEAIRQLRNDTRTGHLPMILLTAQNATRDVVLGFESGADDYVYKPFDPEALVARIRATLRRQTRLPALNPLTRLPGNTAIAAEVKRRLAAAQPFAMLYIDCDNFKAFNDAYGFARGDKVIVLLADVLRELQRDGFPGAFIGHIGGEDFVALVESDASEPFCAALIERFDHQVRALYDQADIERGYLRGVDRFGVPRRFPIVSLSIGVVNTSTREFASYDDVSGVAAEMKGYAKKRTGSGFAVDGRSRDQPIPADAERRGRPLCVVGVSPQPGFHQALAVLERDGRCRTMLFEAAPTSVEVVAEGPDVVVLDLADDGCWQLAAELREQSPALPLLLSSPKASSETRAYAVGAYTFIAEPYPPDYLRACVAQLLRLNERFPPES